MEQYLLDKLYEELDNTLLYSPESKKYMKDFVETMSQVPGTDAQLNNILETLIDYRKKQEMFRAQACAEVR